jgi:alkanesulfonate monooxygenase SsuD/methylene tetrahydromethanopterin reductase-like flavin-dependent oxidoreductase (luciferase family)
MTTSRGAMREETFGTADGRRARRGLYLAPFDELADPRTLVALAVQAEEHGWDGFFLWDHIRYRPPVRAVADPWVALSAIAAHTEGLRLGPLVTPISRRRVHKLARETVTPRSLEPGAADPRCRARQ